MNAGVEVHESVFVAESAWLSGRVLVEAGGSIWHQAVLRAECQEIRIGRMSNVQDFTMLHVGDEHPIRVGEFCSITHHATLHGCTIGDHCLVGIGAVVMDGAVIGAGSIVAGGALVPEGRVFPPASVIAGVPAVAVRERDSARANRLNAWRYHYNAEATRRGESRAWTGEDYERWLVDKQREVEADRDL